MSVTPTSACKLAGTMSQLPPITIIYSSEEAANRLVAGIPAAARSLATLARQHGAIERAGVAVPGGWTPSAFCLAEARRLTPQLTWAAVDLTKEPHNQVVIGAELLAGIAKAAPQAGLSDQMHPERELQLLGRASRVIIKATGKPADGIVSRHINRPISQAITRRLLRWSWPRPGHATAAAALLGIAMLVALLLGGSTGLLAGAVLFQAASIIDGVDGEMARATFRSSQRGAMLDSLTDTATNLGFLAGVSCNVWQEGAMGAAMAGLLGLVVLASGSAILALAARRAGGPFTFDALKHRFRERPSRVKQALVYITMRDFYALAACIAILSGAARPLLYVFATVACGWFAVLCFTFASGGFARIRG